MEGLEETIEYKGHKIKVYQDSDPLNPRKEFDNLGTMVCFHGRYDLGDEHSFENDGDLYKQIQEREGDFIHLPLYLYDHSGITMSTGPFSCPWDSGMVGIIFITKQKIREEYSVKRISANLLERVKTYLQGEVETYDDYLTGNVHGYVIEDPDDSKEHDGIQDSCWGFYGDTDYMVSEAKGMIDWHMKHSHTPQLPGMADEDVA